MSGFFANTRRRLGLICEQEERMMRQMEEKQRLNCSLLRGKLSKKKKKIKDKKRAKQATEKRQIPDDAAEPIELIGERRGEVRKKGRL